MKQFTKLNLMALQLAACATAISLAASGFALSQNTPAMSVQQMSREADEVIAGNVVSQNTRIVANSFETDYEIQVHENLKTTRGDLAPGRNFTITVPGGALQEPPLTQYVMGTAYLYKGEEVMLFLKQGSGKEARLPRNSVAAGQTSKLGSTYKVMGGNQGRFDIVTLKDSGKKVVTRFNLEEHGMANDSTAVREVMQSLAQKRLPFVMDQVARQKDTAAEARDKDPLEFTAADGKKLKVEQSLQKAETMKTLRSKTPIVQDYDEFKAQVKSFVNTY